MSKIDKLHEILDGSVRYEMTLEGLLELTGYCSGKRIYIDLREIDEEAIITEEEYNEQVEEE